MKISILMPCYNSKDYLQRSVGSVLKQQYQNWELVCVDDCSSDNTYDLLKEYAKKDKRIKAIKRDKNGGAASYALNTALEYSDGDYVFLLGHDDELSEDLLQSLQERYMQLGGGIDVIVSDSHFIYPCDKDKRHSIIVSNKDEILSGVEAFKLSIFWEIPGFALVKSDIVKKCGFLEDGMNGDEYSIREMFLNAKNVAFAKGGGYLYYQISQSITKKLSPKKFFILAVFKKLEELAIKHKLEKTVVKKIRKERQAQFFNLWQEYINNKDKFTQKEQEDIEQYFRTYRRYLNIFLVFFKYLFKKIRIKNQKYIVLFDRIKIPYKKLKDES